MRPESGRSKETEGQTAGGAGQPSGAAQPAGTALVLYDDACGRSTFGDEQEEAGRTKRLIFVAGQASGEGDRQEGHVFLSVVLEGGAAWAATRASSSAAEPAFSPYHSPVFPVRGVCCSCTCRRKQALRYKGEVRGLQHDLLCWIWSFVFRVFSPLMISGEVGGLQSVLSTTKEFCLSSLFTTHARTCTNARSEPKHAHVQRNHYVISFHLSVFPSTCRSVLLPVYGAFHLSIPPRFPLQERVVAGRDGMMESLSKKHDIFNPAPSASGAGSEGEQSAPVRTSFVASASRSNTRKERNTLPHATLGSSDCAVAHVENRPWSVTQRSVCCVRGVGRAERNATPMRQQL